MMVKNDNDAQCLCMHGSVCVYVYVHACVLKLLNYIIKTECLQVSFAFNCKTCSVRQKC